jgi:hypothetical protein
LCCSRKIILMILHNVFWVDHCVFHLLWSHLDSPTCCFFNTLHSIIIATHSKSLRYTSSLVLLLRPVL